MKPNRNSFLAVLLAIAVLSSAPFTGPAQAADTAFVSGTEDVPLMDGLSESAEDNLVFDSPAGRIVEVMARGAVSRSDVLGFYDATLPQLGWTRTGRGVFRREGESLKIDFPSPGTSAGLTVRFTLSPAADGGTESGG